MLRQEGAMSIQSAYDRMGTAHCPAFQWVGQSFSSCDRCGWPYWDHSHDEVPAGPFKGKWRRVVITTSAAEKARAHWIGDTITLASDDGAWVCRDCVNAGWCPTCWLVHPEGTCDR